MRRNSIRCSPRLERAVNFQNWPKNPFGNEVGSSRPASQLRFRPIDSTTIRAPQAGLVWFLRRNAFPYRDSLLHIPQLLPPAFVKAPEHMKIGERWPRDHVWKPQGHSATDNSASAVCMDNFKARTHTNHGGLNVLEDGYRTAIGHESGRQHGSCSRYS